jgi:uncharacterized protein YggU (UPF0235/DUF167 family)
MLRSTPKNGKNRTGWTNSSLKRFVLPKSAVNLKSGQISRRKVLEVCGSEARRSGRPTAV